MATPKFITAKELFERKGTPVDWIVDRLIASGTLTLLLSSPKVGKTTFNLHMCKAILEGTRFIGLNTSKRDVVYLTEEGSITFQKALLDAGLDKRSDFHLLLYQEAFGLPWDELVGYVELAAIAKKALLIIDTLPQ